MKFGYTIVYVSDVVKTIEFYKKAFNLEISFLDESNQYAQMDTGQTILAFASESLVALNNLTIRKNKPAEIPAGFEIAFVTDNVPQAFDTAIEHGAQKVSAPSEKPWGQTVAYVRDCNGILVELCTPMS